MSGAGGSVGAGQASPDTAAGLSNDPGRLGTRRRREQDRFLKGPPASGSAGDQRRAYGQERWPIEARAPVTIPSPPQVRGPENASRPDR